METYTIYTLEDPVTNQVRYVGYTKKSLTKRLYGHLKSLDEARKGTRKWNKRLSWIASLQSSPIIQELDICYDKKEVYNLEIYWIEQFRQWGFNLTNMTIGGDGGDTFTYLPNEHQQEIRSKLSKLAKGRKRTKEHIDRWRTSVLNNGHWLTKPGAISPMKGKTHSNETKLKLSKASSGRIFSEEQKDKLRGKIPHNKGISKYPGVIQYSENGIVNQYNSVAEAADLLGLATNQQSSIIRCCKGKTKKVFGYFWKFKD